MKDVACWTGYDWVVRPVAPGVTGIERNRMIRQGYDDGHDRGWENGEAMAESDQANGYTENHIDRLRISASPPAEVSPSDIYDCWYRYSYLASGEYYYYTAWNVSNRNQTDLCYRIWGAGVDCESPPPEWTWNNVAAPEV